MRASQTRKNKRFPGSIAPSSSLGKALVILYGSIFVPLTAVVIRDLGQWALLYLTKMYTILIDNLRRVRGFVDKLDEDEIISLPIKFSVSVMICECSSSFYMVILYSIPPLRHHVHLRVRRAFGSSELWNLVFPRLLLLVHLHVDHRIGRYHAEQRDILTSHHYHVLLRNADSEGCQQSYLHLFGKWSVR